MSKLQFIKNRFIDTRRWNPRSGCDVHRILWCLGSKHLWGWSLESIQLGFEEHTQRFLWKISISPRVTVIYRHYVIKLTRLCNTNKLLLKYFICIYMSFSLCKIIYILVFKNFHHKCFFMWMVNYIFWECTICMVMISVIYLNVVINPCVSVYINFQ